MSQLSVPILSQGGTSITLTYDFMIENGPANIAQWMVMGQWHSDYNSALVQPVHPPLAIFFFNNDKMTIQGAWARTNTTTETDITLYADPNSIQRGVFHSMKIFTIFKNDSTGVVQVWRDGVQIVNYNGPIGYGQGTYWKQGVYRYPTNQTIAVQYRNTTMTP